MAMGRSLSFLLFSNLIPNVLLKKRKSFQFEGAEEFTSVFRLSCLHDKKQ